MSLSRALLVYQPLVDGAHALADQCASICSGQGVEPSVVSSWDLDGFAPCVGEALAVTFGGDGTILRVARLVAGSDTRIVGVQMGRLGFLAELQPAEVTAKLGGYLQGDYWLDVRRMLRAEILQGTSASDIGSQGRDVSFVALNDIVVGHSPSLRTVTVELAMGGSSLHRFRCDGVIVATATGSTAYSFASGGPVLPPSSEDFVITPISPHLSTLRSFVMSGDVPIRLSVESANGAQLTVDGQIDEMLGEGDVVEARLDSANTLFARQGPPAELYRRVLAKLG